MRSSEYRLGIVTWDFLHPKGGMGRSLQWIAEALVARADVIVGAPVQPDTSHPYHVLPLARITRFIGGHLFFSFLLPFLLPGWIQRAGITDLLVPAGPGGVFLSRKPRHVRLIVCAYHTYAQQARLVPGERWKRMFVSWERRTLQMADDVLCFSADTQRALIDDYAIDPARIHLLPHTIDASWHATRHVQKKAGFCICVARCDARKGVEVLLDAWPDVLKAQPDARLLIVGHGTRQTVIDRKIRQLGGTVTRVAQLPFAELRETVRGASIAVCPAYLEGFGLACAEAMTAGTPVVASDSDGLRCLVTDTVTGWLFSAGDSRALSEVVVAALDDPSALERIAMHAKKEASVRFSPDASAMQLRRAVFGRDDDAQTT